LDTTPRANVEVREINLEETSYARGVFDGGVLGVFFGSRCQKIATVNANNL
jgi:hypothetical protein